MSLIWAISFSAQSLYNRKCFAVMYTRYASNIFTIILFHLCFRSRYAPHFIFYLLAIVIGLILNSITSFRLQEFQCRILIRVMKLCIKGGVIPPFIRQCQWAQWLLETCNETCLSDGSISVTRIHGRATRRD